MDARNLSSLADAAFALVVFSRNGIDGVAYEDRARVLNEFNRVLRPGGLLAYSTHNLDYRPTKARGWKVDPRRLLNQPTEATRRFARLPKSALEYRRLRALNTRGDGWAARATFGYGRPVIWHHFSFAGAVRELRAAKFATVELYDSTGLRASVNAADPPAPRRVDTSAAPTLHLVAQKPADH